jgi:hypothetical protein
MKNQKAHSDSEYMEDWNSGTAVPNGAKPRRKTIFIKLHPKPNAPRHSVAKQYLSSHPR